MKSMTKFRNFYYATVGISVDSFLFWLIGPITIKYCLIKRPYIRSLTDREIFQQFAISSALLKIDSILTGIQTVLAYPRSFAVFIPFLIINYLVFKLVCWVYITFAFYWAYMLLKYAQNPKIIEVRPVSVFTGELKGAYWIWAYLVIYKLPFLRMFNLIYFILYFNLKVALRDRLLLSTLVFVFTLPVVFVFYIKIGIPLRVIYDSYRYALYFRNAQAWKNPRQAIMGGILNAYLLPEMYDLLKKRMYKDILSKWNFNPESRPKIVELLARAYTKDYLGNLIKESNIEPLFEKYYPLIDVRPMTMLGPSELNNWHMTAGLEVGQSPDGSILALTNLTTSFKRSKCFLHTFKRGSGKIKQVTGLILIPEKHTQYHDVESLTLGLNDSRRLYEETGLGAITWFLPHLKGTTALNTFNIGGCAFKQLPSISNWDVTLKAAKLPVEFNPDIIYDFKQSLWSPLFIKQMNLLPPEDRLDFLLRVLDVLNPQVINTLDFATWYDVPFK